MDGFKKNLPSPTPTIPLSDLQQKTFLVKEVTEINENDYKFHQMGSRLQNPKKLATKNFMSPTISAASKAAAPRKKILAESNKASESIFSDTHVQKIQHTISEDTGFDSHSGSLSQVTPLSPRVYKSDDDDEENIFLPDSSSQPYNPLTNYLSPRPKFLRYRPNRRIEIFRRKRSETLKGEAGIGINGCVLLESQKPVEEEASIDAYGSLSSSSQEGSVKEDGSSVFTGKLSLNRSENQENESEDNDEDVEEVEEEERNWHLKEGFKVLILLSVLIFSTLFVSNMNSPTPPPFLQAIRDVNIVYQKILGHLQGAAVDRNFSGKNDEDIVKHEREGTGTITDILGEALELQGREIANDSDQEMKKTGEVSDKMDKVFELLGNENSGKSESLQDSQTQFVSDWVDHQNTVSDVLSTSKTKTNLSSEGHLEPMNAELTSKDEQAKDEAIMELLKRVTDEEIGKEEMVEHEMEELEDIITILMGEMRLQDRQTTDTEINQASRTQFMLEKMANENKNSDVLSPSETEVNSDKGNHIKQLKAESISKAILGISIFTVIVGSTVLGFLHLKRRAIANDSSAIVQPSSESAVVKKSSFALSKKEELIEEVDPHINHSSLVHSVEKATKKLYSSRAPTIELLGEYMVGELKSCSMKSKMIEKEEESNFSVSQEKRSRTKVPSFSNHVAPSPSEFSAAESSPSYGSFTAREKIARKEEGKDGDAMKVVTTPVRRSSRIRHRAVMSP